MPTKNIWFSADSHYSHNNIISLCDRPFQSIYEHDKTLVENHNSLVSMEDDYYFLGDFAYRCSAVRAVEVIKKLNFRKMYFLCGNHEKPIRQAVRKELLDDEIKSGRIEFIGGLHIVNDKSLYVSKMIEIEGQNIFISHCAHMTFPGVFRGAISLFGHSHGRIVSKYQMVDVGVDSTEIPKKYFPVSLLEIKTIMKNKKSEFSETDN